jgi:tripartite-type tricarboxylate transporter receptor subunit TctC
MEGAGSLRAANYLYVRAPKDGTSIATFARGGAFYPLLGLEGATFEAIKFNWLGSANNEVSVCVAWYTSGINSVQDLIDKGMTVGGTGPSDDTVQFARVMNGVLNTKLKIVTGYPGGGDVVLAVERGELQGRCGWSWSSVKSTHKSWIDEKKIKVLVQLSLNKHKEMPDVPLVTDLAKTDEQRQLLKVIFARQVMGRPYAAPPGTPQDRVAALRKAFMDTMNDPEFLADSDKAQLEINPVSGEEVQKLVSEIYAETAPDVAKKAGELLK